MGIGSSLGVLFFLCFCLGFVVNFVNFFNFKFGND